MTTKATQEETLEEKRLDEDDETMSNENESPIAGKMSGSMEELERMQGSETSASEEVQRMSKGQP